MPEKKPVDLSTPSAEVRARLSAEIAAGRTISLSSADLAAPDVRANLPALLDELSRDLQATFPGLAVPGYTILATIGQGGMSTVYLARHDALRRHVALKVGTTWQAGEEKKRQRLLDEGRLLARVQHPNIVTIHDVIEAGDTIAIDMEWVDGLTLAGLLRELPPQPAAGDMVRAMERLGTPAGAQQRFATTPVRFFVRAASDLARALQCAHENGILHLDVKPSNVLLRRDGTPLLADFGIGRELEGGKLERATFVGTPVYASPEQLRGIGRLGPHTDVYGLGMTLYEALARTQPLQSLDLAGLIEATSAGRIPKLSTLVPVAEDLETVVHKALDPDPARRYPSAAAFADDLQAFLEHRPVSARPLTRGERLRRWAKHEPWKASLVIVLLLTLPALVLLAGYLVVQQPRIAAMRLREQRVEADRLRQDGYRRYFATGGNREEAATMIDRALVLDPSDASFASWLMIVAEEGPPADVERMLQRRGDVVAAHFGLQKIAARQRTNRTFFTADEVKALHLSKDPIDHYVLAIDRVFRAEDSGSENAYAEAATRLADVTTIRDPDPLVLGLQAWCTMRAGDRDGFENLCRAMAVRWPDDVDVLSWRSLGVEYADPAEAEASNRGLVAAHPESALAWELLAGWASRHHQEELPEIAAKAAAAHVDSRRLRMTIAVGNARKDPTQAAAALNLFAADFVPRTRIALEHMVSPDRAKQDCEAIAANVEVPLREIEGAFAHAAEQESCREVASRLFQAYQSRFPDRRTLYMDRIKMLVRDRMMDDAIPLAREYVPPANAISNHAPFLCRILMVGAEWGPLLVLADRWLATVSETERVEPAYYRGLALARLGRLREAAIELGRATTVLAPKRSYFAPALLESAWLKVTQEADADLHDAPGAAHLVNLIDELGPGSRGNGAWSAFVRAEVLFANADKEGARAQIEKVDLRRRDSSAPTDLAERVAKARQRYLR